ncbi:MAG: cytochrome c biogenesis protein CcdA [Chitinispirillaceae bacterium]
MNNALKYLFLAAACIALLFTIATGQSPTISPALDITAVPSKEAYSPGDTVIVALRVQLPSDFHLYGNPLGPGMGKPLMIGVKDAKNVRWLDIVKTNAVMFRPIYGDWVWAYTKEAFFFLRGLAGSAGLVEGKAIFDGLICSAACYPVHYEMPFDMHIVKNVRPQRHFASDKKITSIFNRCTETIALQSDHGQTKFQQSAVALPQAFGTELTHADKMPEWKYSPVENRTVLNLWLAIVVGFLAGMILNAMPCVLPVIGIKILSFAHVQSRGRKKAVIHSLAFSAGVISVFMLLAVLASFADYSWGKQFQDPRALVAIIALVVVFALGMFDVYIIAVPASVTSFEKKNHPGMWGEFFKGIFTTVLATPCSGPFLGAVLAWSVLQPPIVIFIVYGSIGAGMAFPYVFLSASGRFARLIPKPGRWMQNLKKSMGFILLGFAAYLMLGLRTYMIVPTLLFCTVVAFSVVVYNRFAPLGSSFVRKTRAFLLAFVIIGSGYCISFIIIYHPLFPVSTVSKDEGDNAVWRKFSADSLLAANAAGRNAIVDFTANWCMNCQYNYIMVLTKREVTDLIRKKNVLALKADMTLPDQVQDSLLHSLGSQSIPFLAVFPGDRPYHPIVIRDILTKRKLMKVLNQLR